MVAVIRLLLVLLALGLLVEASAQSLDDARLDPEVAAFLQRHATVPVLVRLGGRSQEARDTWRLIVRALGNQYGRSETPPNRRQEIFAELNRFGLMLVLSFDQVEEIYLPFEMTLPGD
jgi:hypothetical protein